MTPTGRRIESARLRSCPLGPKTRPNGATQTDRGPFFGPPRCISGPNLGHRCVGADARRSENASARPRVASAPSPHVSDRAPVSFPLAQSFLMPGDRDGQPPPTRLHCPTAHRLRRPNPSQTLAHCHRRNAAPVAWIRQGQEWVAADQKRIAVRLRRPVGPCFCPSRTRTDARGLDASPRWTQP